MLHGCFHSSVADGLHILQFACRPLGAGNRNTLLPSFLAFSGFITVKSQRCAFPFDNMQTLRCNSKRLISCFFPLQQKISTQRQSCTQFVQPLGVFVSIWQNCNADAQKFCLQCLPCKREKPQISHNVSRVHNLCNR